MKIPGKAPCKAGRRSREKPEKSMAAGDFLQVFDEQPFVIINLPPLPGDDAGIDIEGFFHGNDHEIIPLQDSLTCQEGGADTCPDEVLDGMKIRRIMLK